MLTRLDVINDMIVSTGARPLLAGNDRHPMYMKADQLLTRVTDSVLALGLWFNTEIRNVQAQVGGGIIVPQDCFKADPLDRNYKITLRQGRMYNLDTGSWYEGESLALRMYMKLDFEEIEVVARDYIRARAVYEFFLGENGADPKLSSYRQERDQAWIVLWRDNIRNRRTNILDNPSNTLNQLRRGAASPARGVIGRLR